MKEVLESKFQAHLIKRIKAEFGEPNVIVLKNDPKYLQGIPDITVLGPKRWALIENKRNAKAPHQANQDYYVDKAKRLSYGAFAYPENEDEIIDDLHRIFEGGK